MLVWHYYYTCIIMVFSLSVHAAHALQHLDLMTNNIFLHSPNGALSKNSINTEIEC